HRIRDFQIVGTRVTLTAQFKTGKTTLRNAVIKSLVDSEPFLGAYPVRTVDGVVGVLDFELSDRMGLEWHRSAGIENDDRVWPLFMRGRATSFNILDRAVRRSWAKHLRAAGVAYLILDCIRPLMDALSLDEHRDGGRILAAFDELLDAAGITEACVVQHMGHNGERARGDSRFRDWPDVEWRLVRQADDPASPRYITAFGRDIDVKETQLAYHATTRRLSVIGGSRQDLRTEAALDAVVEVIGANGASGRAIKSALRDSEITRQTIENALAYGIQSGRLTVAEGAKRARIYRVSQSVPHVSRNSAPECPAAFIRRDTGTHTADHFSVPKRGGLHV
ncbi:MAG TPA: AAA family ATPase, partial [Vicinamibacterales bacterium]|nr:AAA family ATPase [Vicinamibacterales bacterium]